MKPVAFLDFLQELESERQYHANGGTRYRQKTAELSLNVAKRLGRVDAFYNRHQARAIVRNSFPDLPEDRIEDVAKMLSVIAQDLLRKQNLPKEILEYIQKRKTRQLTTKEP
jgi:hypothetical protein